MYIMHMHHFQPAHTKSLILRHKRQGCGFFFIHLIQPSSMCSWSNHDILQLDCVIQTVECSRPVSKNDSTDN